MKYELGPYIELMQMFISRQLPAAEFEHRYLELFKHDPTEWPEPVFLLLDELYAAVDTFCADPEIRDENDLDETQLLDAAQKAWIGLRRLSYK